MPYTFYPLINVLPPGSVMERASTGYFVVNAGGTLGTVSNDEPRFEYLAALSGSAYLSEPAYTNLFTAPEDFTNAAWVHQQAPGDVTVTADAAQAPDTTTTADRLAWNTGSSDTGLSQTEGGLDNGDLYMTSIYVLEDANPDDFQIRNPAGSGNVINGTATAVWQRVFRLDTVVLTYSGMYFRRNAGTGGSLFLWGAMRHVDALGKYFNYHPGSFAGDLLKLPRGVLSGTEGTVNLRFVPRFTASSEVGGAETTIFCSDEDGLKLTWAGDDTPSYLRLYNNGMVVATLQTRHATNDVLNVAIHYGGDVTVPHLEVNGMLIKGTEDWRSFEVPQYAHLGCDADGNQCPGLYSYLAFNTDRYAPVERYASLGDSISYEPYGSDTRSWNVRAGSLLREQGKQILVAGVLGDLLADMAARVQTDVIDQGVTDCVVAGGTNDVATGRTLTQMQTDAAAIYAALAAEGIRVIACTVLPSSTFTPGEETVRSDFNTWLRTVPTNVDLVADTDLALRDPGTPTQLLPLYDSGDHVHPSDEGSDVFADTVLAVASPGSGVDNPSFELPGSAPGLAESWTWSRTASIERVAAFDSTSSPAEDFGSEWRLPQTSGPYGNEFSVFAFEDSFIEAALFYHLPQDDFEFGWDNDGGLISNLTQVTTETAEFDAALNNEEDFENEWNLPEATAAAQNEDGYGGLEDFFDATVVSSYSIVENSNDTIWIDVEPDGLPLMEAVIAAGTYSTPAAMATALQTALDTALVAEGYEAGDIEASVVDGHLRLTVLYRVPQMRLRTPSATSAWEELGFTSYGLVANNFYFRRKATDGVAAALFVGMSEERQFPYEAFEEAWRDNHNSFFSFDSCPHQVGTFNVSDEYEGFETGWTLQLTL